VARVGDLLARARAAGLTVRAEGAELVIRGPRRAADPARALVAEKAAVLAALAAEEGERLVAAVAETFGVDLATITVQPVSPEPAAPAPGCAVCGGRRFWKSMSEAVVCATCHPPAAERLVAEWLGPAAPAAADSQADARARLLALGARLGYARLPLKMWDAIDAGEAAWRTWAAGATPSALALACRVAEALAGETASAEGSRA
jgi:hypothetical protein